MNTLQWVTIYLVVCSVCTIMLSYSGIYYYCLRLSLSVFSCHDSVNVNVFYVLSVDSYPFNIVYLAHISLGLGMNFGS